MCNLTIKNKPNKILIKKQYIITWTQKLRISSTTFLSQISISNICLHNDIFIHIKTELYSQTIVKEKIGRLIQPLHQIQPNICEIKQTDEYNLHAQQVQQKFKWKNSQKQAVSQKSSPNRTLFNSSYYSKDSPFVSQQQFQNRINTSQSLKNSPRNIQHYTNSIQTDRQLINQNKFNKENSEFIDYTNAITNTQSIKNDKIQNNSLMQMRFVKPYQYPKRIYLRHESERTQQLIQQANSDTLYETSHTNLYGKPVIKEPIMPKQLFDSQENIQETEQQFNSVKSLNSKPLSKTFYTSKPNLIKRTETYEQRKARIYKQLNDSDSSQLNSQIMKQLTLNERQQPTILINSEELLKLSKENLNQSSPIKFENQNNNSIEQINIKSNEDIFNQTFSTINKIQVIDLTETSPVTQRNNKIKVIFGGNYVQKHKQLNNEMNQSTNTFTTIKRPQTQGMRKVFPQSHQVSPNRTFNNGDYKMSNASFFQQPLQRQSQLSLIQQKENQYLDAFDKRYKRALKQEINKMKQDLQQRAVFYNIKCPQEWHNSQRQKLIEKELKPHRDEIREQLQKQIIKQNIQIKQIKCDNLMNKVKESRIKSWKKQEYNKYFSHLPKQPQKEQKNMSLNQCSIDNLQFQNLRQSIQIQDSLKENSKFLESSFDQSVSFRKFVQ